MRLPENGENPCLGYPVRQHIHDHVWIVRVIRFQVNRKIMRTVHAFVHHENAGLDNCAFSGFEYHRTDGQLRRSAPLQHFDIRVFLETQRAITSIGHLDSKCFFHAEFNIAVINSLLIHCDGWCATTIPITCEQEYGKGNEHAAQC